MLASTARRAGCCGAVGEIGKKQFLALLLSVFVAVCANAQIVPDIPARLDSVAPIQGVRGGRFVEPAMPPVRTTGDGRLGVTPLGTSALIHLILPEKLTTHFSEAPAGFPIFDSTDMYAGGQVIPFQNLRTDSA